MKNIFAIILIFSAACQSGCGEAPLPPGPDSENTVPPPLEEPAEVIGQPGGGEANGARLSAAPATPGDKAEGLPLFEPALAADAGTEALEISCDRTSGTGVLQVDCTATNGEALPTSLFSCKNGYVHFDEKSMGASCVTFTCMEDSTSIGFCADGPVY